jgi:hypothetical protein
MNRTRIHRRRKFGFKKHRMRYIALFENARAVDGGGKCCEIEKTDPRGCDAVMVVDAQKLVG